MRSNSLFLLAAIASLPAVLHSQAAPAAPAAEVTLKEDKPGLLAKAKVTDATARQAALAKVPGGSIVQAEIEEEKGKLIYSYDVKVTGAEGIQEVAVDARTGAILSIEHESAADEAKEEAADAKKKHS
jgi:uncharacterized membrane protein YkoI